MYTYIYMYIYILHIYNGTVRVLDDNTYMAKETYQYGKRDLPARQKRDGTVGVLDENKMNEFSVECVLFWCTV